MTTKITLNMQEQAYLFLCPKTGRRLFLCTWSWCKLLFMVLLLTHRLNKEVAWITLIYHEKVCHRIFLLLSVVIAVLELWLSTLKTLCGFWTPCNSSKSNLTIFPCRNSKPKYYFLLISWKQWQHLKKTATQIFKMQSRCRNAPICTLGILLHHSLPWVLVLRMLFL